MATVNDFIAQWKIDFPFPQRIHTNDVERDTTADEWAQMAVDSGSMLYERATNDAKEAARITLRKQYRAARTIIDRNLLILQGTPTAAQVRDATKDSYVMWDKLVEALKAAGTLLDEP